MTKSASPLKALLRLQILVWLNWLTGGSRTRKKPSKVKPILFGLLMFYVVVCFAFMFFGLFSTIARPWHDAGLSWLYFSLFALTDFAVMFIFSVFTAKAQLFEAKDNDLLLAMPIPPGKILLSRMLSLLGVNLLFNTIVAAPVLAAWLLNYPLSAQGWLAFAVVFLLLPLFSLALSSLFGWLLSLLTARIRRKSLFTTFFSLLFLAAYFLFFSRFNTLMYQLADAGEQLAGKLQVVLPLYWLGQAIAAGELQYLLYICLLLAVPFVLATWLLSRTFIKTVTNVRGHAKLVYKEKEMTTRTPRQALLRRELNRFLSSSTYLMNAGLGAMFLLVAAVGLPFFADRVLNVLAQVPTLQPMMLPLALLSLCMIAGMTTVTAASIAIEGDSLWIGQSLPVDSLDLLLAKLKLHLLIALPPLLLALLSVAWLLRPQLLPLLAGLLLVSAYAVFTALLGLVMNLRHPNLEAISETQAVKNSISVLLTMLINWAAVISLGAGGYGLSQLTPSWAAVLLILAAVVCGLCLLLWRWLRGRGVAIYRSL